MADYDLYKIMRQYDNEHPDENADYEAEEKRKKLIQHTEAREGAIENNEKEEQADISLAKSRDAEYGGYVLDHDERKLQRKIAGSFANALNIKNAQKIILISNTENMRKGLNKEIGSSALMKTTSKGQMSTITIPTQLLRRVQQEIGGLSVKATQNDIMTGFLYWYFGRPEDVWFGSQELANKMREIVEALNINSSPAQYSRQSQNVSETMIERIDMILERLDVMNNILSNAAKITSKTDVKVDKLYIATCYNILNMLAFAPPVMPGEQPKDIDLLANGAVWDLMSGVDSAHYYFNATNGREMYKDKVRKRLKTVERMETKTTVSYVDPRIDGEARYDFGAFAYDPNDDDDRDLYDLDNEYYGDDDENYRYVPYDEYEGYTNEPIDIQEIHDDDQS